MALEKHEEAKKEAKKDLEAIKSVSITADTLI